MLTDKDIENLRRGLTYLINDCLRSITSNERDDLVERIMDLIFN